MNQQAIVLRGIKMQTFSQILAWKNVFFLASFSKEALILLNLLMIYDFIVSNSLQCKQFPYSFENLFRKTWLILCSPQYTVYVQDVLYCFLCPNTIVIVYVCMALVSYWKTWNVFPCFEKNFIFIYLFIFPILHSLIDIQGYYSYSAQIFPLRSCS